MRDSVHRVNHICSLSLILPFQDAIRQLGGKVRDGEKVTEIKPGLQIMVKTTSSTYQAKNLVITAGPWTNRVLSLLGIELPLQVGELEA